MSESANATDHSLPASSDDDGRARRTDNPAERLHLAEAVRMAEAIVFASAEPVSEKQLAARLPDGVDVPAVDGRTAGRSTRGAASTWCASATPGRSAPPATSPS